MVQAECCHIMENGASSGHGRLPPSRILLERFLMHDFSNGNPRRILWSSPLLKWYIGNRSNKIWVGGGPPWQLDATLFMFTTAPWQRSACTMDWTWPHWHGSVSGFHHRSSWLANADYSRDVPPSNFFNLFVNFCRAGFNRGPQDNLVGMVLNARFKQWG